MSAVLAPPILHSRYDPKKEALRFFSAFKPSFKPKYLVVGEPGDSWLSDVIRQQYPQAIRIAIRYQDNHYRDTDELWHYVWRPSDSVSLESFLLSRIPDEDVPLVAFLAWKPAERYWPEVAQYVWKAVSGFVNLQKSIMHTRSAFGKRWLSNMLFNSCAVTAQVVPSSVIAGSCVLVASGPTLESIIPRYHSDLHVIAVSSALEALHARSITPDLCIAADGGYWAGRYLACMKPDTILVLPLEAAMHNGCSADRKMMILDFGSPLEKELQTRCGIRALAARRNATVTGIAAEIAIELFSGTIYAAGLDLQTGSSISHCRPHLQDHLLVAASNRLGPLASRYYERNRDNRSLDAYAAWFESRATGLGSRLVRLSPAGRCLQGYSEISPDVAMDREKSAPKSQINWLTMNLPPSYERKQCILSFIQEIRLICRSILMSGSVALFFHREMKRNTVFHDIVHYIVYRDLLTFSRFETENGALPEDAELIARQMVDKVDRFLEKQQIRMQKYVF